MIKNTPPMGWNSWNTFGSDINEDLIRETADALVSSGLKDAGYEYVVIDDCWSLKERDKNGRLQADPEKFPSGMKALADYIHSKGLKFGMYSCAGNSTCAGYPGSHDHEFIDAETFAEWEVDYLKYDYCFHAGISFGEYLYRRMSIALEGCGRDILFSACTWGTDETHKWIKTTNSSVWRSTGDIYDSWASVTDLLRSQTEKFPYAGRGCFNDMDMLVVGMHGEGNVGLGGCTYEEYKAHFSAWAFLASPLMIGCDIRNMDEETKSILTKKELIKINQDICATQPWMVHKTWHGNRGVMIYARILSGGDIGLCIVNTSDSDQLCNFTFDELSLPMSTNKTLSLREVWTDEVEFTPNNTYIKSIPAHTCKVYRCKVINIR